MKNVCFLICLVLLTACSTTRVSHYDEFEKMKVDRLTANSVSSSVFARTLVCLNATRESKGFVAVTNQIVSYTTNFVVSATTNTTVTTSGNQQIAWLTNATATPAPKEPNATEPGVPSVPLSPPLDSTSTGVTTATASNASIVTAPNQGTHSGSIQIVTTLNRQVTVNKDSLAITSGTNEVSTVETNYLITAITNQVVTAVTNVTVAPSVNPVADYYLSTEIAPSDFALATGESLIVLADGVRYGCTVGTPATAWETRHGYLTTHYKVTPEVIVAIANAKEVRLRIKGTTGTIERTMNHRSRRNFREFLIQNFGAPQQTASAH